METIPKAECREIGFIRKTHGVYGGLVLEYEPEFEESVAETDRFFLEVDGLLVPFFLKPDGLRFKSSKTAIIEFEWVTSEETARSLTGCRVYLFNEEIIDEPHDDEEARFMNFRLIDENNREIGEITAVDDYSGNIVFTVHDGQKEMLVPYHDELLISADDHHRIIKLRLPEGLLD